MSPGDVFWHLLHFAAPALGVAVLATGMCKLLWREALHREPYLRLMLRAAFAGLAALVGSVLWSGQDGRMAGYGAMLAVVAWVLWWPTRRRWRG